MWDTERAARLGGGEAEWTDGRRSQRASLDRAAVTEKDCQLPLLDSTNGTSAAS